MQTSSARNYAALFTFAAVAVCVLAVRACLQSITIDEATSFLMFSKTPWAAHWWPSSGNHVLNSLLMRLVTTVFGVSEPAVRAPALFGGVVYIGSAFYLSVLVTGRKLLQVTLFICLVYNPIVLDYLVAARGYGLALGFYLAALAIIASTILAQD